ncbi:acyl-CoA dehydrogenase [Salinicoccus sp. ID82-1]|uniref:acyl-CoA dehydrogenase n=1 Tax=Salinicoccus sp. ID82-1 TaxID=2820269 RepID=UPI001F3EA547|nr:acyl-CoA dehydrogenase [Salinicoccus sp. ID82-1]MCG1009971.1 acyl-CoA dehydrogenase [Salinicoccus sp. ID82-1]
MIDQQMTETVRKYASDMEQNGKLDQTVLDLIYEHRLFKLFVPDAVGGRMTPFPEAIRYFEDTAYIDGSFGWLVQIGSGAGFFATVMDPRAVQELFSVRNFYIAGSDRPLGVARKTDDGYIVNGAWPYASGADHASLFTATCRIESDDSDDGLLRAFAMLPDQVRVESDWNAFGLCATGSHTIHVEDALVPAHYRFDVADPHFHYDNPIYHYPFEPFAAANIAATTIGIARHFFDAARAHIEEKETSWKKERHVHAVKVLDDSEAAFLEARKNFHSAIESSWAQHQQGISPDSDDIPVLSKIVAHHAVGGAQKLYRHLGMDVIMADHPLNRIYRDLLTASQHGLLTDTTGTLELDGQQF